MNICVLGLDYKTPVSIREKASYTNNKFEKASAELSLSSSFDEFIILSTCNRSEIYFVTKNVKNSKSEIFNFFAKFHNIDNETLLKYAYFYSNKKAILHLLNVCCGFKSLVLGEDQILGQIKDAHQKAIEHKTSKAILNKIFLNSITLAKKIKSEFYEEKSSISVSSIGIKLIERFYNNNLKNKTALIIGTGKMGSLALKYLSSTNISKIYITNRTHHHIFEIKDIPKNAQIIKYNERYDILNNVDIIISSTASPHYTITLDEFEKSYKNKKLCMLDIAVPRDIEAKISEFDNVTLYTIDDLQQIVKTNIEKRQIHKKACHNLILNSVNESYDYITNYDKQKAVSIIHKNVKKVCERQLEIAVNKLNITDEAVKGKLSKIIKNTANSIANPIIEKTKVSSGNFASEFIKNAFEKEV